VPSVRPTTGAEYHLKEENDMAQKVAIKTSETNNDPGKPPFEVHPDNVKLNSEGFLYDTWVVHLPEGATHDGLRDPRIWRRSMLRPQTAFKKYAQLMIFSFDESQVSRAIVCFVKTTEAHLCIESTKTFRAVGQALYRDDDYYVAFENGCYKVRHSNGASASSVGHTREADAIAEIHRISPKKVV
jgi:hypothetical protein